MAHFNYGYRYNGDALYNDLAEVPIKRFFKHRRGAQLVLLDQDRHVIAVLAQAYDAVNNRSKQSTDTLTFKMPYDAPSRSEVVNERYVRWLEDEYLIKNVRPSQKAGGSVVLEVECERDWYDLGKGELVPDPDWVAVPAQTILADALAKTGWQVGTVAVPESRTIHITKPELANPLYVIRRVEATYEAVAEFDSARRRVHLRPNTPLPIGTAVVSRKNMTTLAVEYDTTDIVTRLYAYGKDGLTFADINGGRAYVDNHQYTDKVLVEILSDERFTNPFALRDRAQEVLAEVSKPRLSFDVTMVDLSYLTELSHEELVFGGAIRVFNERLSIEDSVEIVGWKYNISKPGGTVLKLASKPKSLSQLLTNTQQDRDALESGSTADQPEILDMAVFNYLLNSRAENGLAYWTAAGWSVDNDGFSSDSSFKCDGQYGATKTLSQTVHPAHRDTYVLSLRADVANLDLGNNGRIGVEVEVTYEDNSTETVFLPLVDQ